MWRQSAQLGRFGELAQGLGRERQVYWGGAAPAMGPEHLNVSAPSSDVSLPLGLSSKVNAP